MPKRNPPDPKAKDLLPPDAPPDDEPKRIAERRVVGWNMADRIIQRVTWRPAGNSRDFWKRIEDDDPFEARRVPVRLREDHTLYPADRIDRMPTAAAPQPASRPAPPEPPRPQPKASAPPPKAALNADPRVAKAPVPPPRASEPPPEPEEPMAQPTSRLPPQAPASRTGRIRISGAERPPTPSTGILKQPAAAEIRAEKEAAREQGKKPDAPPPPRRSLDSVLAMLGELRAQEALHKQGLLESESAGTQDNRPPPKPQRLAEPTPAPAAQPKPRAEAAPVDRTPPRPATPAPKPAAPVDRTPPKPPTQAAKPAEHAPPPTGSAGLNDLFGGGPQEGRVRIGKRTAPAKKEGEEG